MTENVEYSFRYLDVKRNTKVVSKNLTLFATLLFLMRQIILKQEVTKTV